LDLAFKALPSTDPQRQAWLNLDRFSTQWVTALPCPSMGWVLGNDVFPEVAATYLALPSPACASLVGRRIGRYQAVLDPLGHRLAALSLPGDGWRVRHDELKHLIAKDVQGHGVPCTCEVFGLFAPLLPQGQTDLLALPRRKRQGLVPDFLATLPQGFETLLELKVIGGGTSHYLSSAASRCYAVAARARAIPQEYQAKATRLDRQHCDTPEGCKSWQDMGGYGVCHLARMVRRRLTFTSWFRSWPRSLPRDIGSGCRAGARVRPLLLCHERCIALGASWLYVDRRA